VAPVSVFISRHPPAGKFFKGVNHMRTQVAVTAENTGHNYGSENDERS
jgi:hypothetical protein